jgi:hypothetical protein
MNEQKELKDAGIKTWHIVLAVLLFWWGFVELFTK